SFPTRRSSDVERALVVFTFCSIATAGAIPLIYSTLGLSNLPKNCLAYEDKLSTYRLCPSAYNVSKAKDDFPEPESPVTTTNLFLGIATSISFRLCSPAPLISMFFFGSNVEISVVFIEKLQECKGTDFREDKKWRTENRFNSDSVATLSELKNHNNIIFKKNHRCFFEQNF